MPELSVNSPNPQLDMRFSAGKPCLKSTVLIWRKKNTWGKGPTGLWWGGGFLKRRCCRHCRHSKQVNKYTRKHWCFHPWILYNLTLLIPFACYWFPYSVDSTCKHLGEKNCWGAWCAWQDSCWTISFINTGMWLKFIHPKTQSMILCAANSRTPPWFWAATTG